MHDKITIPINMMQQGLLTTQSVAGVVKDLSQILASSSLKPTSSYIYGNSSGISSVGLYLTTSTKLLFSYYFS